MSYVSGRHIRSHVTCLRPSEEETEYFIVICLSIHFLFPLSKEKRANIEQSKQNEKKLKKRLQNTKQLYLHLTRNTAYDLHIQSEYLQIVIVLCNFSFLFLL